MIMPLNLIYIKIMWHWINFRDREREREREVMLKTTIDIFSLEHKDTFKMLYIANLISLLIFY